MARYSWNSGLSFYSGYAGTPWQLLVHGTPFSPRKYEPSFPVVADMSSTSISGYTLVWPHHTVKGHNVAYMDGSVRWLNWRADRMNYTTVREHTTSQSGSYWWKDFWQGY